MAGSRALPAAVGEALTYGNVSNYSLMFWLCICQVPLVRICEDPKSTYLMADGFVSPHLSLLSTCLGLCFLQEVSFSLHYK